MTWESKCLKKLRSSLGVFLILPRPIMGGELHLKEIWGVCFQIIYTFLGITRFPFELQTSRFAIRAIRHQFLKEKNMISIVLTGLDGVPLY